MAGGRGAVDADVGNVGAVDATQTWFEALAAAPCAQSAVLLREG